MYHSCIHSHRATTPACLGCHIQRIVTHSSRAGAFFQSDINFLYCLIIQVLGFDPGLMDTAVCLLLCSLVAEDIRAARERQGSRRPLRTPKKPSEEQPAGRPSRPDQHHLNLDAAQLSDAQQPISHPQTRQSPWQQIPAPCNAR